MKKFLIPVAVLALSVASVNATNVINEKAISPIIAKSFTVSTFCKLIQMGDFDAVKALVEAGEDVNQKSNGLTPLMFAARHNKADIAQLLIDNGAELRVKSDKSNLSALKWAELTQAKETYVVIKKALKK